MKIIDDDVDSSKNFDIPEEELFAANEDAPQIVGVIDERPPELRIADYRQSDLWQPVGEVKTDSFPQAAGLNFCFRLLFCYHCDNPIADSKRFSMNLTNKQKKENDGAAKSKVHIKKEKLTPPRRPSEKSQDLTPLRAKEMDISPLRRRQRESDDISPPRRVRRQSDDYSPPRKSKRQEDLSPPRKSRKSSSSPPRRIRSEDSSPRRRQKPETSTQSPARKRRSPSRQKRATSTEDLSPPRKREKPKDNSRPAEARRKSKSPSRKEKQSRWNKSTSPEPKKMKKTLDGKTAGLQQAKDLAVELEQFKQRENSVFRNLPVEQSGANAATVLRDRKTGKIRNLEEEQEEQRRKQEEEDKNKEKYSKWGRGLKQVEDINTKIAEDLHEMSKPLARYADDEDLERYLKEQEREEDPMLAYIRKKKKKEAVATGKPMKPTYEGEFMPNRFGIRPGYRWDGVDRSNGYEKRWFEVQNEKRAQQEEVYKWSTEDM